MDTNNICATEYDFEQFVQDYDAGEFITLSELVPSSHASTEVIDTIITEIPCGQTEDNVMDNLTFGGDDHENLEEINSVITSGHSTSYNAMDNVKHVNENQEVYSLDVNLPKGKPDKSNVKQSNRKSNRRSLNKSPIKGSKKKGKTSSYVWLPEDNSDLNFDMIIGEDDFPVSAPSTSRKKVAKVWNTKHVKTAINETKKKGNPKRPKGRPPKTPTLPSNSETITSTVETKRKRVPKKKYSKVHDVDKCNNENCDITSSSITDNINGDEFPNKVTRNTITFEEKNTSHALLNNENEAINNIDDSVNMCNEIAGEVEVMTSTNDMDDLPLVKLSKVKNKVKAKQKTTENQISTNTTKKRKSKKKLNNSEDDGMENVCLSDLKNNLKDTFDVNDINVNDQHPDVSTTVQESVEMEVSTPFDDSQVGCEDISGETSKRPVRKRARKTLHYEQDSDEDPFANVELSDDEPRRGKKGSRYYSDDEYIPINEYRRGSYKLSDSEVEEDDLELLIKRKKKKLSKSPKKKIIEENVPKNSNDLKDDIEKSLEPSVIKLGESEQSSWGTSKEFENFLAKKVGTDVFIQKSNANDTNILPLDIPVLDINETKKTIDISTQTNPVHSKNSSVQTDTQYELSMLEHVKLNAEQSEKACEFLSNIVKTTAELGKLMTEKSEDFIQKKINTKNVTDTLRMDYCVKKSFLLFKLAKHNLIQMEEDLAKHYEDFLKSQNLLQHREVNKVITAKAKQDNDSDCEIVEVIADDKKATKKNKQKPAINPKTVFLNKELSIKIAKKPSAEPEPAKNIKIKGRHTVWINDSIMVKKVKPNQSFLAQDSRNKKPPDSQFITLKMVNDFFESYNRQKVLSTCAPFVEYDWFTLNTSYCCFYSAEIVPASTSNCGLLANNTPIIAIPDSATDIKIPKPLLTLCIVVLKKHIKFDSKMDKEKAFNQFDSMPRYNSLQNLNGSAVNISRNEKTAVDQGINENLRRRSASQEDNINVKSLSVLCLQVLQKHIYCKHTVTPSTKLIRNTSNAQNFDVCHDPSQTNESNVNTLITLCLQEIQKHIYCKDAVRPTTKLIKNTSVDFFSEVESNAQNIDVCHHPSQTNEGNVNTLITLCLQELQKHIYFKDAITPTTKLIKNTSVNLFSEVETNARNIDVCHDPLQTNEGNINSLITLCLQELRKQLCGEYSSISEIKLISNSSIKFDKNDIKGIDSSNVKSLFTLSFQELNKSILCNSTYTRSTESISNHCQTSIKNYNIENNKSKDETIAHERYNKKSLSLYINNVNSLQTICYKKIVQLIFIYTENFLTQLKPKILNTHGMRSVNKIKNKEVASLSSLCTRYIQLLNKKEQETISKVPLFTPRSLSGLSLKCLKNIVTHQPNSIIQNRCQIFEVKTLSKLCLEIISLILTKSNKCSNASVWSRSVVPLKEICFDKVRTLTETSYAIDNFEKTHDVSLTINEVNTVSEDFFDNDYNSSDEDGAYDDTECGLDVNEESHSAIEDDWENNENTLNEGNEWASHIQMGDLRSCIDVQKKYEDNFTNTYQHEASSNTNNKIDIMRNIKQEPCEESMYMQNIMTVIKDEPNEDVLHTEALQKITKREGLYDDSAQTTELSSLHNTNTYDVDAFEKFVSSNKLMYSLAHGNNGYDEMGDNSFPRIRRQYEPDRDSDGDNFDDHLGLLIPQNVEQAKDRLMYSSSDENGEVKKTDKRKCVKKKGKLKKPNKEVVPTKSKLVDDVAILTKKMKGTLQQEDNHIDESDDDDVPLILRRCKNKSDKNKVVDKVQNTIVEKEKTVDSQVESMYEVQCNNIDSTENIETMQETNDLLSRSLKSRKEHSKNYEISKNYKLLENVENSECQVSKDQESIGSKQVKNNLDIRSHRIENSLYKDVSEENSHSDNSNGQENTEPEINLASVDMVTPVEPTVPESILPILDTQTDAKQKAEVNQIKKEIANTSTCDKEKVVLRNGWKCYPVDYSDTKLCDYAFISLEKLPESFVETYFQYKTLHNKKDEDDIVIDRLTNLQTLNREKIKGKEVGRPLKSRSKTLPTESSEEEAKIKIELVAENADELSLSEDESHNNDDLLPPPIQENSAENYLAKRSLMGENESEPEDTERVEENTGGENKKINNTKLKLKTTKKEEKENRTDAVDLLLTADRMMNSELALLHAPATGTTDQIIIEDEDSPNKNKPHKHKPGPKSQTTTVHIRKDDDSSSEEEKQWVTTKEKLLKKLEKKQDNHVDDAKRAKIVSEFIEKRREDGPVSQSVLRGRPRRSNKKKLLERRKQMKVLNLELYGEDASTSRKYSSSYAKGRRNIRKVIDKKSLARKTVLANIEEFERKRRLTMREAQLKETLNFEEDVNVVVINDELCLEYDFDNDRPAVSVHPYFTKVMKAHQYEGVKFMWDACFETVETVKNGGNGGGCILAHCMGLGKTLQVLALLHTVMTHPEVSMQRVLVCCPLSTVLNWVDEIHKWIGPVTNKIKVFELSKLKKTYQRAYQLEDWYTGGGIFIIGYELFRSLSTLDPMLDDVRPTIVNKIRTALLDPGPDIIICDEGHLLKNDMSVLAVAMSRVVTKRRIVLTGTPMQNNLREYYCMVNFIKPNLLGTYSEYSNRFENPIMNGQHRDSREEDIKLMKQRTHILHKVLEGCLQRQEASVLYPYLPKKYEYTVFISLTACQWDLYKHYIAQTKAVSKGNKSSTLKDFHVLQKIWTHPQVLHQFQTKSRDIDVKNKIKGEKIEDELLHDDLTATEDIKPTPTEVWWLQYLDGGQMLDKLESSNKFLVVFRLLDECVALGDKVLIFSTSLFVLDSLEFFLRRMNGWSLGEEYYRLDGAVPAEVRQKWCREFNEETNTHTKLFLISTRAGCLGLNMTAANRVIILDTSWNPAHDIQSIFRVYRFGQKKDCFIYRLVALGTMEQKMYERSVTKQAVACRVVDEQQIDRHYNMAELSELYSYDEEGWSVGAGLAAGVRDAALLRVAAALQCSAGALHAVREHDSLLRDTDARLPEHERAAAWHQFQQEHRNTHEPQLPVKVPKKVQLKVHDSEQIDTTNTVKQETVTENAVESKVPRKRGRPRKYSPEPIQPSTSKSTKDDIHKNQLMQRQFDAAPGDTGNTGEKRQCINTPNTYVSPNQVTGKIAEVFRHQTIPPLTDCIPSLSSQQKYPEITPDSNRNVTDSEQDAEVVESSSDEDVDYDDDNLSYNAENSVDNNRKRQKIDYDYIPSQYHIYKKTKDTVNISHGSQEKETRGSKRRSSDVDKIPPPPLVMINTEKKTYRNINGVKTNTNQVINHTSNLNAEEITSASFIDQGISEDTIDISDEETEMTPTPAPKEIVPITTANRLPSDILLPVEPKNITEAIPLPRSLLTNPQFIKILAHMYVSSSPLLDEDAATRAAEYSSAKALRELDETGEQICSGNLYDIALKVYGSETLKKLNLVEANVEKQKVVTNTNSNQMKNSQEIVPNIPNKGKKENPKGEEKTPEDPQPHVTRTYAQPMVATQQKVTPVSMVTNQHMITPVSMATNQHMITPVSMATNQHMITPVSMATNQHMITPVSMATNQQMITPVSMVTIQQEVNPVLMVTNQQMVTAQQMVTPVSMVTAQQMVTPVSMNTTQQNLTPLSMVTAQQKVTPVSMVTLQQKVTPVSTVTTLRKITPVSMVTAQQKNTPVSMVTAQQKVTPVSMVTAQQNVTPVSMVTAQQKITTVSMVTAQQKVAPVSMVTAQQNLTPVSMVGPPYVTQPKVTTQTMTITKSKPVIINKSKVNTQLRVTAEPTVTVQPKVTTDMQLITIDTPVILESEYLESTSESILPTTTIVEATQAPVNMEKVVPVGMFTGSGTLAVPSSREESILPDDEDVTVMKPTTQPAIPNIILKTMLEKKRRSLLINSVTSSNGNNTNVKSTDVGFNYDKNQAPITEPIVKPAVQNKQQTFVIPKSDLGTVLAMCTKGKDGPILNINNPKFLEIIKQSKKPSNEPPLLITTEVMDKYNKSSITMSSVSASNNKAPTAPNIEWNSFLISKANAIGNVTTNASTTTTIPSNVRAYSRSNSEISSPKSYTTITNAPTSDTICLDSDDEDLNTGIYTQKSEPTKVTKMSEPTKVTKMSEPTKVTKMSEPTKITKMSEPTKITKISEPTKITKMSEISVQELLKIVNNTKPTQKQYSKAEKSSKTTVDTDFSELDTFNSGYSVSAPKTAPERDTSTTDQTMTMTFDDGASINFVSVCDTPVLKNIPAAIKLTSMPTVNDKKAAEKYKTITEMSKIKPKKSRKQYTEPQINLGTIDLTDLDVTEPKQINRFNSVSSSKPSTSSSKLSTSSAKQRKSPAKPSTSSAKPSTSSSKFSTSSAKSSISPKTPKQLFITKIANMPNETLDKIRSTSKRLRKLRSVDLTDVLNFNPSTSAGVKRHKKPEADEPPKKPKMDSKTKPSSALKSLMDLSFDDIDDIVELE